MEKKMESQKKCQKLRFPGLGKKKQFFAANSPLSMQMQMQIKSLHQLMDLTRHLLLLLQLQ